MIIAFSFLSRTLTQLSAADPSQADIVDETLDLFRANSLFRNFEIKGPADRTLIVLILFISDCLAKLGGARTVPTQIEASKLLNTLSVDTFPIPGDANFPLNAHYAAPSSRADSGTWSPSSIQTVPNVCNVRLFTTIPDTGSTRTSSTSGRKTICRWNRKAKQVVDVFPKETLHEQESGNMKSYSMKCRSLDYNANVHPGILREYILLLLPPLLVRVFSPVSNLRHVTIHS